tara:strand:- start:163 stop:1326 length:1164 start_codon:yes stop_codon:yes gene_type:complete
MSTLKVDGIRSNSATSDAITLASDGTCTANITNKLNNRNKIINGDFIVHQRGGTITASGATYSLDRWRAYITGSSPGGYTVEQSTSSYPQTSLSGVKDNFKASVLITVTSAGSASSNNNVKFQQRIEGNNVYDLAFGTAAAKKVTVSFYVKCSITGTFGISLVNGSHDRSNVQTYTVNSASTWERKTITFDGDTSGTWDFGTGTGMQLMFDLGSGSAKDASSTGTWLSGEYHGTSSSTKLVHTNGATLQFAGIQLEAGSIATDFEHRSFAQELQLCQRYYYQIAPPEAESLIGDSLNYDTMDHCTLRFPVEMRVEPSFICSDFSNAFRIYGSSGGRNVNTLSVNTGVGSTKAVIIECSGGTNGSQNFMRIYAANSGVYATIATSAEL